jgi:hypothetical protein
MFDVGQHLDELRSWPTGRLHAQHEELLDERGQIDTSVGRDGESANTVREKVETARARTRC